MEIDKKINNKQHWYNKIDQYLQQIYQQAGRLVPVFGYVMAINFPLYYFLTLIYGGTSVLGPLRMVATVLSIALVLLYRFRKESAYLAWVWFVVVTFCLPFFFTYNLFHSDFNTFSIVSLWTAIFLTAMVLPVRAFLISLFLGAAAAFLVHLLTNGVVSSPAHETFSIISNLVASIIFIAIFSHSQQLNALKKQLTAAKAITAMFAHELRSPLMTLGANVQSINRLLPRLIDGYQQAIKYHLLKSFLPKHKLEQLKALTVEAEKEINQAHGIINVISSDTQLEFKAIQKTTFSVSECIKKVIDQFYKANDLISFTVQHDFTLHTDAVMLSHVFHNLLRNAVYAIKAAGKGNITINVKQNEGIGIVMVEDTGIGMSPWQSRAIFKPFYTTKDTKTSSGLGLYYCKQAIEKIGGSIKVESQEGEFTRFILQFKLPSWRK